jgi:hypothetical protein
MNAFVPSYRHDIFVSYARVDDIADLGVEFGWVSSLINGLKIRLSQKLGRGDIFELWKDEQLAPNKPLSPEILEALKQSATLVIILSPGYIASEWCQREMQTFWQELAQRMASDSRIFVIERDKLEFTKKPKELKDLLGYQFWYPDPDGKAPRILGDPIPNPNERLYYDKLGDLANDLAKELERLRSLGTQAIESATQPDARPTVYLAEVTDDLDIQRDQVFRHLDQEGYRVIPTETSHYPAYFAGGSIAAEAIAMDMKNCKLFVQLLSNLTGKCLAGQPSFPHLQYRTAQNLAVPVLQWRHNGLQMETIGLAEHRALVEADTVLAIGLEEFKQECITRLKAQVKKVKPTVNSNLVFLNASNEDLVLGQTIGTHLSQNAIGYALPLQAGDPKSIQEDWELNLSECDGLIIVYGPATYAWARAQILRCRRIISLRDRPLKALAVFESPPEEKNPLGVDLPGMMTLNCRQGLQESRLQPFLAALLVTEP